MKKQINNKTVTSNDGEIIKAIFRNCNSPIKETRELSMAMAKRLFFAVYEKVKKEKIESLPPKLTADQRFKESTTKQIKEKVREFNERMAKC